eukprot:Awhi_evm1s2668
MSKLSNGLLIQNSLPKIIGTRRFKGVCCYDGTDFYGFQEQKDVSLPTVQKILSDRISGFLGVYTQIVSSGRTDRGVHALGQVFCFDVYEFDPKELDDIQAARLEEKAITRKQQQIARQLVHTHKKEITGESNFAPPTSSFAHLLDVKKQQNQNRIYKHEKACDLLLSVLQRFPGQRDGCLQ